MPIPEHIRKYMMRYPWKAWIPEYPVWRSMIQRCNNPKAAGYKHYGGRGIKVCKRWLKFENFLTDMGIRPSKNHSLDRVDVDGNYEPRNCRWATTDIQATNTRKRSLAKCDIDFQYLEEYKVWIGIISRCHNKNDPYYAQYGGRGLRLTKRWARSFSNFLKDMGRRPQGHWITLRDQNRNYSKSNCYWIALADLNRKRAREALRSAPTSSAPRPPG